MNLDRIDTLKYVAEKAMPELERIVDKIRFGGGKTTVIGVCNQHNLIVGIGFFNDGYDPYSDATAVFVKKEAELAQVGTCVIEGELTNATWTIYLVKSRDVWGEMPLD